MGRKTKEGLYKKSGSAIWQCRFYMGDKLIRRSTKQEDEVKAYEFYLNLKKSFADNVFDDDKWTVQRVLDHYHQDVGQYLKGKGYAYSRRIVLDYFSNMLWTDLYNKKKKTVSKFIRHRQRVDTVSAATINKEIVLLSAAVNYVIKEEGAALVNVAKGKKLSEPSYQYVWITPKQARALIVAASQAVKAPHLVDFIIISLNTGMRPGEVLNLKIMNIDLEKRFIYLPTSKNERHHEIPINDEVVKAVQRRFSDGYSKLWLFAHENGQRIKSVKRSFKTACIKANIPVSSRAEGIKGFRMHDQRHSFASWLVSDGVSLEQVQDLLNHKSIKTTERYAHLDPSGRVAAINKLPDLI